MKGDMAAVVRKDRIVNIAADDLRVDDLVLVQTGDIVPADLKLVEASDLEVDEFELTGEIMPVSKRVQPEADVLVLQGGHVLRGHGKGVVIAVGENTEFGKILKQSGPHRKDDRTRRIKKSHLTVLFLLVLALMMRLRSYTDPTLIYVSFALLVLLLLLLLNDGFFNSLVLRRLKRNLFKHNILLQQEGVLNDISKVDVFCFDKTGVLTSRNIEVKGLYIGEGDSSAEPASAQETWKLIVTGCTLCHDLAYIQTMALANPLDRALISFAENQGTNIKELARAYERIYHKPFNSEERYMACGFIHSESGNRVYFAKGDPDVLLRKCSSYVTSWGERKPLDFSFLSTLRGKMNEMIHEGNVILAMAFSESPFEKPPSTYTFLCLIRLENPLKPDAKPALRKLSEKGIRNVVLTGDRTETALRIAAELGIEKAAKYYLTGRDIGRMLLSEVARQCEYVSVFARLSPSQKGIIVRIFQQRGHRVAMIGDGTNDVIAIKSADVGISFVERSSPMAKRTAKILINDLADLPNVIETARKFHRQVGFITLFIALLFLASLLGGYRLHLHELIRFTLLL